jgi:hypothetical protein
MKRSTNSKAFLRAGDENFSPARIAVSAENLKIYCCCLFFLGAKETSDLYDWEADRSNYLDRSNKPVVQFILSAKHFFRFFLRFRSDVERRRL